MTPEIIGKISGIIVIVSVIPYSIRTYQRKISPNIVSWNLWSIIGLALLLTYNSSGAKDNVWPTVFGFFNPIIIVAILFFRNRNWGKLTKIEYACLFIGLISIVVWSYVKDIRELAQYALYIAIAADSCAAIPTLMFLWKNPNEDRPFAWVLFAIGYGLAIFAITENTIANYILPIYMFVGAFLISLPLILFRIKNRVPIKEWI